jgi:hypothetical protein
MTTNLDSIPFRLQDVHLCIGQQRLPHLTCPFHSLDAASFVCLEFTNQKNGVRGGNLSDSVVQVTQLSARYRPALIG